MFKKSIIAVSMLMSFMSYGAELNISKLRINFEKGQTADFLTLENHSGTVRDAYQVSVKKWTQKENLSGDENNQKPEEILEDTDDIIVSPKTLVLQPEQDKTIRLIVNNQENAQKNYSYRLIINQLPNKDVKSDVNQINLLFKISLPIFVYTEGQKVASKMNIQTSIEKNNGKNYLVLKNSDTQHLQVTGLEQGNQSYSNTFYLLPNVTSKTILPKELDLNKPLEIITDKGNLTIKK